MIKFFSLTALMFILWTNLVFAQESRLAIGHKIADECNACYKNYSILQKKINEGISYLKKYNSYTSKINWVKEQKETFYNKLMEYKWYPSCYDKCVELVNSTKSFLGTSKIEWLSNFVAKTPTVVWLLMKGTIKLDDKLVIDKLNGYYAEASFENEKSKSYIEDVEKLNANIKTNLERFPAIIKELEEQKKREAEIKANNEMCNKKYPWTIFSENSKIKELAWSEWWVCICPNWNPFGWDKTIWCKNECWTGSWDIDEWKCIYQKSKKDILEEDTKEAKYFMLWLVWVVIWVYIYKKKKQ